MANQGFDIRTLVKLLAPKEIGIKLVPLGEVEEAETGIFWATIFISIATTILGSIISLVATNFQNLPVIVILSIFLIIFILIAYLFIRRAFQIRVRSRSHAFISSEEGDKHDRPRDIQRLIGISWKVMYLLKMIVFSDSNEVTKEHFMSTFKKVFPVGSSDEDINDSINITLERGLINKGLGDKAETHFVLNIFWSPEKYYNQEL